MVIAAADTPGDPPAVLVRNLSKSYSRDLRRSQRNGVTAIFREVRRPRHLASDLLPGEFWALQDVSFAVPAGAALGVLGRNGAGKSTLLRLIGGISKPTSGEVVSRGQVGSLLDVNAGFSTILTGRENVAASFTLLRGHRPTPAIVREIADYAGIADAMDHPVRTYSQGMRMRLGFAVIVHVDPDILLIDETLAVGDTAFQLQCIDYLHSFGRAGGTLIFTSHSLWLFQNLATMAMHLDGGRIVCEGLPEMVADHYLAELQQGSWVDAGVGPDPMEKERVLRRSPATAGPELTGNPGDAYAYIADEPPGTHSQRPVQYRSVSVTGPDGGPPRSGEPMHIRFDLTSQEEFEAELGFMFWTADLSICVAADLSHSIVGASGRNTFPIGVGYASFEVDIAELPLTGGQYAVRSAVYHGESGDIQGMTGFEDTPTWFEVLPARASAPGPTGEVGPHLRPLRTIEVESMTAAAAYPVASVDLATE